MKQRIICTVTNDLSYDQRMIRICSSLAGAGYEVWLVGRELPESVPLQAEPFRQKRLACFFRNGKLFYLEFNLRLLLFLLRQPFDLICAVDLDTLVSGFLAGQIKNKICIFDAHEHFAEVPEVVDRPFTRWVWNRVAQSLIPQLRYAYTVGPQLAQLFGEKYGIPFDTIRNLPVGKLEHIAPPAPGQKAIILYQGRLNTGRGLEAAILAMHQVAGAELWLAGEGDLSQNLRRTVEAEELTGTVKFLGYLRPQVLQTVTLQAHIGLNLLENKGLSYYYSLANKAFDYVQAGVPSIQMDFPEYRRLQDQYRIFALLNSLAVSDLANLLNRLIEDREYWLSLHRNCLEARKTLRWENEEKKLIAFYRGLGR